MKCGELPTCWHASSSRFGPSRFVSMDASSGLSKLTVAAECTMTSQPHSSSRSSSDRLSPSTPTSPDTTVMRRAQMPSNSSPHASRRRSNASLRRISRSTRRFTSARRPGRTSSTSSQSGTERSSRSTSAVPKKPVAPVMAMRLPVSASAITMCCLAPTSARYAHDQPIRCSRSCRRLPRRGGGEFGEQSGAGSHCSPAA